MFERRLGKGREEALVRKCLEEIKERVAKRSEISGWEEERRAFFKSRGVRLVEIVERGRGEWFAEIERKDLEEQRKEK